MGRKKRKADQAVEDEAPLDEAHAAKIPKKEPDEDGNNDKKAASSYAMKTHSGEIVHEDVYVSDGSEDEDDLVDIVLAGSKMGLMRRGNLAQVALVQPNRQWTRQDEHQLSTEEAEVAAKLAAQRKEEELAKLDPAERAARLAAEKAKLEEQEQRNALQRRAEENAGRDPALFSKRTAFDIRLEQMEDKPWERSNDLGEFFNYGFNEDEWNAYAQRQLDIRQELMDAARAKRPPDPNLVPVQPCAPAGLQRVVNGEKDAAGEGNEDADADQEPLQAVGPSKPEDLKTKASATMKNDKTEDVMMTEDVNVVGGAWGAGVASDSYLARLIEEQEQGGTLQVSTPQQQQHGGNHYQGGGYDRQGYGQGPPPPPPPPQQQHYDQGGYYGGGPHGGPPPYDGYHRGRGRGGRGGYGRKRGRDDYY